MYSTPRYFAQIPETRAAARRYKPSPPNSMIGGCCQAITVQEKANDLPSEINAVNLSEHNNLTTYKWTANKNDRPPIGKTMNWHTIRYPRTFLSILYSDWSKWLPHENPANWNSSCISDVLNMKRGPDSRAMSLPFPGVLLFTWELISRQTHMCACFDKAGSSLKFSC